MGLVVTIGGSAVKIMQDSLSIDDVIRERSTASFVVYDATGTESYARGEAVTIRRGNTLYGGTRYGMEKYDIPETLFTGYVDKPVEKYLLGKGARMHTISCKDQHYLADKRLIAKAYEGKTIEYIVNDILTSYLAVEGVTAGTISASGITLTSCTFNYVPVTRALESLAEKAGYIWYIDYDKKLYFMSASTLSAPWSIGSSDILADSISVDRGNAKYRNKQYIKGGKDITDPMTESFKGDGENQTFTAGFPLAKVPTVKVDTVTKTVGIRGIDSDKDWYWSKGEKEVTQDSSGTTLTSSNTLDVIYQGQYDIVVISADYGEVDTTKVIEGSSGLVEDVEDRSDITNLDDAIQGANALLARYAQDSYKVKFRTLRNGLKAGQMATVTIPQYTLESVSMLVESVAISTGSAKIWYDVTLAYGAENESWAKMFVTMAANSEKFVINENISEDEVLVTLHPFSKTWFEVTANNIFSTINPGSSTQPGSSTYPCFEPSKRVTYAELLTVGGTVLLRKPLTKQTGSNTLVSTFYINSNEGNGSINTIKFYGGDSATSANGTGILVDSQIFSTPDTAKTKLEVLQIEKTDIKGW